MVVLGSSFQFEEINYMKAEAMEEYALASAEAAYEDPGEQAPMEFLAASHWWDIKKKNIYQPDFLREH